jgi:Domain of unknown function (DUF4190)/GYF domain 2
MNAIYKIIGKDGKEYGPATGEQIRQWIGGGRIERQTPIFVEGAKDWNFVGLLPEFANYFAASGMPPTIVPPLRGTSTAGRMAKTNSYAQAGMIFGILSVTCCCGFPFGILGLVFSLVGLSQINANPELHEGRGMAIAGLILSILSLLLGAGWLIFNLAMNQPRVMWNVGRF